MHIGFEIMYSFLLHLFCFCSCQLSDAMLPILDDLVDKFDDPAQADALTSVIHSNDFE